MIKLATLQCSSIRPSVSVYSLFSVCSPRLYLLSQMCIYMYAYQVGGVGGDWEWAIRVTTPLMTDQKRRSLSKLRILIGWQRPSFLSFKSFLSYLSHKRARAPHPSTRLSSVFLQIYSFKKGGQTRNLPRTALRNLSVSELVCLGRFFFLKKWAMPCTAGRTSVVQMLSGG